MEFTIAFPAITWLSRRRIGSSSVLSILFHPIKLIAWILVMLDISCNEYLVGGIVGKGHS